MLSERRGSATETGVPRPSLELRLRDGQDPGRAGDPDADDPGRAQPGMPADRRGSDSACEDVLERLTDLFTRRGTPDYLRSDNGPEFTAKAVREWLERIEVKTLYIEPGSPWENGYVEYFHGKLRDELLNGELFDTLREAKVLIERWRVEYKTTRPHSALGYRPPAPEAVLRVVQKPGAGHPPASGDSHR